MISTSPLLGADPKHSITASRVAGIWAAFVESGNHDADFRVLRDTACPLKQHLFAQFEVEQSGHHTVRKYSDGIGIQSYFASCSADLKGAIGVH